MRWPSHLEIDRDGKQWMAWNEWFDAHGLDAPAITEGTLYDTYSTLVRQALNGHGVLLGWRGQIDDLIDRGYLVVVGTEVMRDSGGHFLLWPKALDRDPRMRVLRQWLDETLALADDAEPVRI